MRVRAIVSACCAVAFCAAGAAAQTPPAAPPAASTARAAAPAAGWGADTVRLSVDIGVQGGGSAPSQSSTLQIYQESAPLNVSYGTKSPLLLEGGLGVHVHGRFGVGVAISYARSKTDASVQAQIPNPFYFGQLRPITGTASALQRTEVGTHIDALYLVPVNDRFDVMLSGGPSILYVQQDLVSSVNFSESYPYDTAAYTSAGLTRVSKSGIGFNVGADFSWRITKTIGFGGLVRFTRATLSLPLSGQPSISTQAGGVQAGAGIRLLF
ncbi:MAG: hypothetical protein KGN76_16185 [Acidobacteriota bacterium]|nr:hypothetical protein [Acidobacteriota bacterium]